MPRLEPVPEEKFRQICLRMTEAEMNGELGGMFKGERRNTTEAASKEKLLSAVNPSMKLYKSFFLKIYGYELTYPGFAEIALSELEKAGCSRAREHYTCIKAEHEHNHEKEMRSAAAWHKGQEVKRKDVKELRKQQEVELLQKKKRLLEQLLQIQSES